MPEEVLKNIYRLSIPLVGNPLKELNAYLIKGRDGERDLLIDTGFAQTPCRDALFREMEEAGAQPGAVDVLLTHLHSDHSGLCRYAAGEEGMVYISRIDRFVLDSEEVWREHWDAIEARYREEGFSAELMKDLWKKNPAQVLAPPRNVPHIALDEGDVVERGGYKLQCVLTPGHTPGHMCFWMEEQGAMFLGDHVLFDISPNITCWNRFPDALGSYLDSLKKIREYDVKVSLPAHRASGELKTRVDWLLQHHRERLEEALTAVRANPGICAFDLAGHMTWKIRSRNWAEFPLTQKWFAVGETIAHLERLEAEGKITRVVEDGIAGYFAV